ncbi:unnamed protein product [Arctia plantaginis]|uniref:Uncharacterized protein n=1 Tax=Arctia plantaginis TaxID=874455 RepID=A0A8S1A335_ARCPL|nr:unnamed protein product [Arctia plantaginis]
MNNSNWKSPIANVKTFPGADCGFDHVLLVACLSLHLKAIHQHSRPTPQSLYPIERLHFQSMIENKLAESSTLPATDTDTLWESFDSKSNESLSVIVSKRENDHRKTDWITDHMWELFSKEKKSKREARRGAAEPHCTEGIFIDVPNYRE